MRRDNDFYPTPAASVRELLHEIGPEIAWPGIVLDPACGDGALLCAVSGYSPLAVLRGIDVDENVAERAREALPHATIHDGDYLSMQGWRPPEFRALTISNPPYSLAQEFVTKMLAERGPNTIVCALLRLNFLGSQKRENWWRGLQRPALRVLSKRPSFTGDGRTDSTEYAWYIWSPTSRNLGIPALDWYSGRDGE